MHMADRAIDLRRFIEYLHYDEGISWQVLHAKVLARSKLLPSCSLCNKRVVISDLRKCHSHLKEPSFTKGAHIGIYPCCGKHVVKQNEISKSSSVQAQQDRLDDNKKKGSKEIDS